MRGCYIHIPFCEKICAYCDFCKVFYNDKLVDKYLKILGEEVKTLYKGDIVDTIYIGGGTPSCLSKSQLTYLFSIITNIKKTVDCEITIEANFSNTTYDKLKLFKDVGINRLSFGYETGNKKGLELLEREESPLKVQRVISDAKKLGFKNINVDLIYAWPGEDIEILKQDLDFIYSLDISHISCYSLIIEDHTKLKIKNIKNIDEDLDYLMYKTICEEMVKHGFSHYEISNYSKPGYFSKHNTKYWNNEEYYGFGLGASGYIDNIRYTNTKSINKYLKYEYLYYKEILEKNDMVYYEIMLGLRKSEGISLTDLYKKYSVIIECGELVKNNLIKLINDRLFIPEDKWYISNEIILRVLEGVTYG